MHILLVILRKTELGALADFIGRKTGSRRRFGRQESGRLVLVAWAKNIKIAIFLENKMKLEQFSGGKGNQSRNLRSWFTLLDRFEFKPVTTNLCRSVDYLDRSVSLISRRGCGS